MRQAELQSTEPKGPESPRMDLMKQGDFLKPREKLKRRTTNAAASSSIHGVEEDFNLAHIPTQAMQQLHHQTQTLLPKSQKNTNTMRKETPTDFLAKTPQKWTKFYEIKTTHSLFSTAGANLVPHLAARQPETTIKSEKVSMVVVVPSSGPPSRSPYSLSLSLSSSSTLIRAAFFIQGKKAFSPEIINHFYPN